MKFYFAVKDSDGSLIVKLCGTYNSIAPIFSSNNFLTVVFKTDSSNNATGFKASWTSVDIEGSIIKSQHYPLFYPLDVDQVKGRMTFSIALQVKLLLLSLSEGKFTL